MNYDYTGFKQALERSYEDGRQQGLMDAADYALDKVRDAAQDVYEAANNVYEAANVNYTDTVTPAKAIHAEAVKKYELYNNKPPKPSYSTNCREVK